VVVFVVAPNAAAMDECRKPRAIRDALRRVSQVLDLIELHPNCQVRRGRISVRRMTDRYENPHTELSTNPLLRHVE